MKLIKQICFYAMGISVFLLFCVKPAVSQTAAPQSLTRKAHKTAIGKQKSLPMATTSLTVDDLDANSASLGYDLYQHDSTLDAIYSDHLQRRTKPNEELFYVTWFPDGNSRISRVCHVASTGQGYAGQDVHNWAFQANIDFQLNPAKLKSLRSLLLSLPPSSGAVPLEELLILSYREGVTWKTRQYNRSFLPAQVQQAYLVIGVNGVLNPVDVPGRYSVGWRSEGAF